MCKIHVQQGCFVIFRQQQDCRLVFVIIIRQESLVDLNHVIDILHLFGNEIHTTGVLCVAADNGVLFLVNEDETPPFLMKRSWLI
jgi:hypothetical protein